ncbi:hypothetical protein Nepgr_003010 [Nepenthes gracilis]|uniref:Uncharacterized protein n=1 Tax=Nepenthes gracilis TaxID=150966 RepID=A0AAD3XD67_NEPGR|nr:hypothetical protein Nepgr_003010 [Nepenthes gracilis]
MAVSSTEELLLEPPRDGSPESETPELDRSLRRLESFLRLFGFCQYLALGFSLSWLCFIAVGIAVPVLVIEFYLCFDLSNCEKYEVKKFELEILICEAIAAAISLLCISHNLRKYGVRKFLFVDRYHGGLLRFRDAYIKKINEFFRLLAILGLPCFILKTSQEVVRVIYLNHEPLWKSMVASFALLVSWAYLTTIYLSGTLLFNLICNLQVIHFENYGKLLERDLDVSVYIEEHMRLTYYLSKISHRFRIFLLLEFLVVTASQFLALLETTGNQGIINFINGADFAVLSIVQVVGIIVCLQAATKITHKAQGLASIASRWHALVTSSSTDTSQLGTSTNGGNMEHADLSVPITISYSESDIEATDYVPTPTNLQLVSYMSSYHKRQAFVMYMLSNTGGVTIFGWTIDRALLNTIFFVEMSLVAFVLGKTISFSTK